MHCYFVAASICVSNVNSMATVLWEDFALHVPRLRNTADAAQLRCIKAFGSGFALLAFGGAFLVGMLTGVVETAQLASAATGGPLIGVFLLAMLVPAANAKGAIGGMVCTMLLTAVWAAGYLTFSEAEPFLATSVEGCTNETFSPWIGARAALPEAGIETSVGPMLRSGQRTEDAATAVFTITYMYYSLLGAVITLLVGSAISWMTDAGDKSTPDERLLNPHLVRAMHWWRGVGSAPAATAPAVVEPPEKALNEVTASTSTITTLVVAQQTM